MKRKLEELNLMDDFLFGSMMSYPGIGEAFAGKLLETVFGRKFGKLKVIPQKAYYGGDTDQHGARLDVYIEESQGCQEAAAIYDVETQSGRHAREALPKRVRFYHAKIDGESLKANAEYKALKRVVILMIMPYDPFGQGHMVYTIKNNCVELPDMPYEDGAKTVFLYTKGKKGNAPEALRQLLRYFEDTTQENAANETLKEIHQMVEQVKMDKEVSSNYMWWSERVQMWKEEGFEEGRAEERKNTEAEKRRADEACQRANEEKKRADEALKRLEDLERQMKLLREQKN